MEIRKPVGIDLGSASCAIAVLDAADCAPLAVRDTADRALSPTVEAWAATFRGLRDLLARTVADPRQRFDAAVVAVPESFTPEQAEGVRQAAALAGFEVLELIPAQDAVATGHARAGGHGDTEPDLRIAVGAALRAAAYGTRYVFQSSEFGVRSPELGGIELHITGPGSSRDVSYPLTGAVRPLPFGGDLHSEPRIPNSELPGGYSVRVRSRVTGLAGEAFLDGRGAFAQEVELEPGADNPLELSVCDDAGSELVRVEVTVRHLRPGQVPGAARAARPGRAELLDPPWPQFAKLVRRCLDLSAEVADRTGRDREELFAHTYAQERYAEQAFEGQDHPSYRECHENLQKYAVYLEQLLRDNLPRPAPPPPPPRPPEEEAREAVEGFRSFLAAVWKQVRARGRADLEKRLAEVARQAGGLTGRVKAEPAAVLRDARRLGAEVHKVEEALRGDRPAAGGDGPGLLEGSG
jgi:hypothetical protein